MSDVCCLCKKELEDGEVRFYIASATEETDLEDAKFLACVCLHCALKTLCKVRIDDGERLGKGKVFQES